MFTATKNDIASLKNTAQNFGEKISDKAEDTAQDAHSELRDAAGKAGRKVRALVSNAGDELSHAKESVEGQIRDNPVQSTLIALGAGFLLGALFRR